MTIETYLVGAVAALALAIAHLWRQTSHTNGKCHDKLLEISEKHNKEMSSLVTSFMKSAQENTKAIADLSQSIKDLRRELNHRQVETDPVIRRTTREDPKTDQPHNWSPKPTECVNRSQPET